MRNVKLLIFGLIIMVMTIIPVFSQEFIVTGNPIIPHYDKNGVKLPVDEGFRNSSDPTVGITQRVSDMTKTLWLFTSCDLPKDPNSDILYPMSTTYCYKTEDLVNWIDCGPVITEDMFSTDGGWADVKKMLWAPNYKCVMVDESDAQFMLYVPGVDTDGVQRIGIASAASHPDKDYTASKDYFQGIGTHSDPSGYAYDPGVFCDAGSDINGDWYMSYCTAPWSSGRIAIARMTNLYSAYDDRLVQMRYPGGAPVPSDWYMEGPEIHKYYINDQVGTRYYLIFALKEETVSGESIAYAMATEEAFHNNPWTCWEYQDIIMQPNNPEWTNHATIVNFKDHMLFFYHKTMNGESGTNRRVCVEEFNFNQFNGTIPTISQTSTGPGRVDYSMVFSKDMAFYQSNIAQPRIYIKNTGTAIWTNFKAKYYFTVENGKTPKLQDFYTPDCDVSLEHLNGNKWAVVLDFNDVTLNPGERIPSSGGELFGIHYSDWSYFDKTNDFSQPKSDQYNATYKLNVFDSEDNLIYGKDLEETVVNSINIMSGWSGRLLTVSNEEEYGLNDRLVKCQPENTGWSSQDWVVKNIQGKNTVRLYNIYSETYLTVRSEAEDASVICQPLDTSWLSQEWYIENIPGTDLVRFRNAWAYDKYLTVEKKDDDYSSIWSKSLRAEWPSQKWSIE